MAGRRTKPEVNRRTWHENKVKAARTPKEVLWALCHWLVAEAFHAGPDHLQATTDLVRARIAELTEARKEATR
ncbi:hypothetical protein GCM10011608_10250 [Micromonospora sonchi]|uniref:Uncharacterized protein n=1 Tax=Micromonospora sonchi TaxID=1763543 RepID=A0A917TL98_9ACTN|nr:hypothetical protein [Micromonospora sonchi]GGM27439.1 hypothetical protein GCM10011608_10250 [Micromonospora sonchi]